MRGTRVFWIVAAILIPLCGSQTVRAQGESRVEITAPLPGAYLQGSTTIRGTTLHPTFVRYELAFAYDSDLTGTWFTIQEPVFTAVDDNGILGQWDTTGLTDGTYGLRLRVYVSERDFLEAVVRGLRVANLASTATLTPTPASILVSTATLVPGPTVTAVVLNTPIPLTARESLESSAANAVSFVSTSFATAQYEAAFWNGVTLSFALFSILGVYWVVRSVLRQVWRNRHEGGS